MKSVRRPLVAVSAVLVLVVVQAVADPTGLLALVGWSGAGTTVAAGVWPFAPYVVGLPVLLGMVWWVTVRAGERYWTLVTGVVLAVLLAQALTCLAMTWIPGVSAWAAGYVTAKAIPAALIVAAVARWFGGPTRRETHRCGPPWIPAALFAAAAPLLAGEWWTSAAYAPGVPVARPDRGPLSVIVAVLLIGLATVACLRWMRRRVPGVLGGWLAALVAGGLVGLVQAVVAFAVDGGLSGDLWPAMAAYVAVADGLSFGACVGWIVGVGALVVERIPAAGRVRVARLSAAAIVVVAVVVALGVPAIAPASAADSTASGSAAADAAPAGFLRASGTTITDGRGDQVLLRGVNVNQLVDFYQPKAGIAATRPLTEADFVGIAAQGFDVVRLNLSWSALEPTRGTLSQSYLAAIKEAVGWARQHGIYVVLDMHQDGWWKGATPARADCRPGTDPMWGYDGAPAWATITDGAPRCQFTGRDISPAGDRAFQNFYFDTSGVQSALVATWGELAQVFRDEPTVAGYDLLNEPGFGETAPVTTSYLLGRFYDRVIGAIRAAGSRQIVVVEPSIFWSGLGFDSGPTPGFTTDGNIVFSPHLYAESITMDRSLGLPPIVGLERQFTLAQRVAAQYDRAVRESRGREQAGQRVLGVEAGVRRSAERHRPDRQRAAGAELHDRRRRGAAHRPARHPEPCVPALGARRPQCVEREGRRPAPRRHDDAGQLRAAGVGARCGDADRALHRRDGARDRGGPRRLAHHRLRLRPLHAQHRHLSGPRSRRVAFVLCRGARRCPLRAPKGTTTCPSRWSFAHIALSGKQCKLALRE